MPPGFKKSLRGILASVRSSVMENSSISLDDPLKRILGHQQAPTWADVAFSNVMKCGDGLMLLSALQNDYRICKAGHFKKRPLQGLVEHEFIVIHLRYKSKTTYFRIDRSIGHISDKMKQQSRNATSEKTSQSSTPSHTPGSWSGSSMESILMSPSRLVDYCVCRLSSIAPNRHWARDTIIQIPQVPSSNDAYELTTIEFTGSSSAWPSLWDLVHLVRFLNQECEEYDLIDAQCYWYADMVSVLLEEWCPDTKVTRHHGWQGTKSKNLVIPAPGTIKGLPIYRRDPLIVQDKRRLLLHDIQSSNKSTIELLDMRNGGDRTILQVQEDANRQIEKAREDADQQIENLRVEVKAVEGRAERAEGRAEKAEGRVERAEARAREAEEQIHDLSAQLRQSQDLLKKFEARVSDSDALMARIVARLDDFKAHGLGASIIA